MTVTRIFCWCSGDFLLPLLLSHAEDSCDSEGNDGEGVTVARPVTAVPYLSSSLPPIRSHPFIGKVEPSSRPIGLRGLVETHHRSEDGIDDGNIDFSFNWLFKKTVFTVSVSIICSGGKHTRNKVQGSIF